MNPFGWFRRAPRAVGIAPLDSRHATRLSEIHASAFPRPWDGPEFERLLADRAVVGDGVFLERSGTLCGFVLSRRVLDEAELLTVAMEPEARGRGFTRPLLAQHLDALARLGTRLVHLEVEEGNAPAIAAYRRAGFEKTGRRDGYYLKRDGSRATALTMQLRL